MCVIHRRALGLLLIDLNLGWLATLHRFCPAITDLAELE
jgi:hypothetical protein